jgi:NADH-quinone oxidoreductase subunit C/D
MSNQDIAFATDLTQIFPDIVTLDERPSYEGYLVKPEFLLSTVQRLRDDFGYDYLSSITGVDYLPENKMEVVYHIRKSTGGSPLVIKAQIDRENPVINSLVQIYPGAEFQEREAWDLLGIKFEGHPDLRRILTWEKTGNKAIMRKMGSHSRAAGQQVITKAQRKRTPCIPM